MTEKPLKKERIPAARVAAMCGYSARQVQIMAAAGKIPSAAKLNGKRWTFDPVKVERWIQAKEREFSCQSQTSTSARGSGTRALRLADETLDEAYEQALSR